MSSSVPRWPVVVVGAGVLLGLLLLPERGWGVDEERRAALAALGAGVLAVRWAWPAARRVATGGLLLWCGLVLGGTLGSDLPRVLTSDHITAGSHFHYVMGSRYFPELGYADLYEQTLASDRERSPPVIRAPQIRDLRTYELSNTRDAVVARSEAWTDARWAAFAADLRFFGPRVKWANTLSDRGYNASPTGHVLYHQLTRLPVRLATMRFLGLLDLVMLAGALGWAARVFGPIRALTTAAFVLLWFGNEHRVVGYPVQYDYLAALLCMACAWRTERPALAGGLLAYAAMVRVFPVLLVGGLVAWALGRRWAGHPLDVRVRRFLVAFGVWCVVLVGVGCTSQRGPGAWVEWGSNIAIHSDKHRVGEKRIGLSHLFTYQQSSQAEWPRRAEREAAWEARKPRWMAAAGIGGLLWLGGGLLGGRRGDDALSHLVIAVSLAFLLVVMSRYYASVLALAVLLGPGRDERGEGEVAAAVLFAIIAAHYVHASSDPSRFGQFFVANALLAVAGVVGLLVHLMRQGPIEPSR